MQFELCTCKRLLLPALLMSSQFALLAVITRVRLTFLPMLVWPAAIPVFLDTAETQETDGLFYCSLFFESSDMSFELVCLLVPRVCRS